MNSDELGYVGMQFGSGNGWIWGGTRGYPSETPLQGAGALLRKVELREEFGGEVAREVQQNEHGVRDLKRDNFQVDVVKNHMRSLSFGEHFDPLNLPELYFDTGNSLELLEFVPVCRCRFRDLRDEAAVPAVERHCVWPVLLQEGTRRGRLS